MKKVLTVLAILVVLTSAIFAETHKITIKAFTEVAEPVFQMSIDDVSVTTNTNETKFGLENNSLTKTVADALLDLEQDGFVDVVVTIANAAKTNQTYTLTFGDGEFTVKRGGSVSADKVVPQIETNRVAVTGTGFTSTGVGRVVTLAFAGTTCVEDAIVATARYSYTGDPSIDPGVTYTADITLNITEGVAN